MTGREGWNLRSPKIQEEVSECEFVSLSLRCAQIVKPWVLHTRDTVTAKPLDPDCWNFDPVIGRVKMRSAALIVLSAASLFQQALASLNCTVVAPVVTARACEWDGCKAAHTAKAGDILHAGCRADCSTLDEYGNPRPDRTLALTLPPSPWLQLYDGSFVRTNDALANCRYHCKPYAITGEFSPALVRSDADHVRTSYMRLGEEPNRSRACHLRGILHHGSGEQASDNHNARYGATSLQRSADSRLRVRLDQDTGITAAKDDKLWRRSANYGSHTNREPFDESQCCPIDHSGHDDGNCLI
jgi:hypothetical protein